MRKDVGVAIFIGFLIGIIAALTVTNLPKILRDGIRIPSGKLSASPTPPIVKTAALSLDITVDQPKDESIADAKSINISGNTKPGQTVLIETSSSQDTADADSGGKFTQKLDLTEGVNTIYLSAYDESGNAITKTVNVYYTSEKL